MLFRSAWKAADVALLTAHRNVEYLLKSNDVDTIKRAKELEAENARLKRMYAELALENAAIKDVLSRKL